MSTNCAFTICLPSPYINYFSFLQIVWLIIYTHTHSENWKQGKILMANLRVVQDQISRRCSFPDPHGWMCKRMTRSSGRDTVGALIIGKIFQKNMACFLSSFKLEGHDGRSTTTHRYGLAPVITYSFFIFFLMFKWNGQCFIMIKSNSTNIMNSLELIEIMNIKSRIHTLILSISFFLVKFGAAAYYTQFRLGHLHNLKVLLFFHLLISRSSINFDRHRFLS